MATTLDIKQLAKELFSAYSKGEPIAVPPSGRDSELDLGAAYEVGADLTRMRQNGGRTVVGRKVGFANKAMWRILKLDTLVWSNMYDNTVHYGEDNSCELSLAGMLSPRIEPEIVVRLRTAIAPDSDAAAVLAVVEWIALGFEINDCLFPDWKFTPVDFVAAFGFHTALLVGEPKPVTADAISALVDQLAKFKLRLLKNGELAAEGSGRNSLRSPALCVSELASAIEKQPGTELLSAGELISTGTLTDPMPVAPGETWTAELDGLDLPALSVRFDAEQSGDDQ